MDNFSTFYKKHTTAIISLVCILGMFFIIFQVTIPGLFYIGQLNQQVGQEKEKLDSYKKSLSILSSLSDTTLSSQVEKVTQALPPSKDLSAIYLALTTSASKVNVGLKGFTVSVGGVYDKNAKKEAATSLSPSVSVKVQLSNADIRGLTAFSKELLGVFPLSKINSATSSEGGASVDISFFYRPYDLDFINKDTVTTLTSSEEKILQSLPPAH